MLSWKELQCKINNKSTPMKNTQWRMKHVLNCSLKIKWNHSRQVAFHSTINWPVARRNSWGWKSMHWIWPSWYLKSCNSFPAVKSHSCQNTCTLKSSLNKESRIKQKKPVCAVILSKKELTSCRHTKNYPTWERIVWTYCQSLGTRQRARAIYLQLTLLS